jgi:agmatinase
MGNNDEKKNRQELDRRDFLAAAAAAAATAVGFGSAEAQGAPEAQPASAPPAKGSGSFLYNRHAPKLREHNHALPDLSAYEGMKYQKAEAALPSEYYKKEIKRIKELGLDPVDSIQDKTEFSCFQRGSLPHWSGINTFLKLPYLEDVRKVGEYDVAFVGVPFDIGCTFRTGTRFGPQGIRRISALYQKYS